MGILKSKEPEIPAGKPSAKKVEPKKAAPRPKKVEPKIVMYKSTGIPMTHPFQNVRFNPGVPVACIMDDWLEGQMAADLIVEVEK